MAIVEALDAAAGERRRPRLRSPATREPVTAGAPPAAGERGTTVRSRTARAAHPALRSRARVRDEEEALRVANHPPYGPNGSLWRSDRCRGDRPDRDASSGGWPS